MTTPFYSAKTKTGYGVVARMGISLSSVSAFYTTLTKLLLNDIIHMVKIPAGATVLDVLVDSDVMDASAALLLNVGDSDSAAYYIAASTVAQAGGVVRLSVTGSSQKKYTTADTIQIKVNTGPTDTTLGTIRLTALYTMDL